MAATGCIRYVVCFDTDCVRRKRSAVLIFPPPGQRLQPSPRIPARLKANRRSVESGVPTEMQQYFPKGYYFCYVWHGLTWIEVGLRDPQRRVEAIRQAH
ncbi:MAG TPA: hypothetical protein DCG12_03115 [Planctomycetaceae bacterium]|nr:hypothetical protein [Planctomycetaceae bacterium]